MVMSIGRKESVAACVAAAVLLTGCGSDGGDSGLGGGSSSQAQSGTANPLPASITANLRVSSTVPGAQQIAFEPSIWLAWFSSPAQAAGEVYTLPGARVDALGTTWAIADQQGVARFRSLPPKPYRFVVSTATPGVIFQTLVCPAPGASIDLDITERTTAATLVALEGSPLGDTGGADLESLTAAFGGGALPSFNALLAVVEQHTSSGLNWLDGDYLPESSSTKALVTEAEESVTFIGAQFPVPGQVGVSTGPLILGISFNHAVDPSTLAPIGGGSWSLQTSAGLINAGNLAQFGTVSYTDVPMDLDGRAIPAHTLYFRLPNLSLTQGALSEMTLSLGTLPRDTQDRQVLCARPASRFAQWNFVSGSAGIPGDTIGSNVGVELDWVAAACQGSTSANLTPVPAPVAVIGSTTPNSFNLEFYQYIVPLSIPAQERVLLVDLLDPDTVQLGDVYQVKSTPTGVGYSLGYEERLYTEASGGPSSSSFWNATGGTMTVTGLEGGRIVLTVETTMTRSGSSDSFCLQTTIDTEFP